MYMYMYICIEMCYLYQFAVLHTSIFQFYISILDVFLVLIEGTAQMQSSLCRELFDFVYVNFSPPAKGKWIQQHLFIHNDFDEGGNARESNKKLISSHKVSFAIESRNSEGYDVNVCMHVCVSKCLRFFLKVLKISLLFSALISSEYNFLLSVEMCAHASRSK